MLFRLFQKHPGNLVVPSVERRALLKVLVVAPVLTFGFLHPTDTARAQFRRRERRRRRKQRRRVLRRAIRRSRERDPLGHEQAREAVRSGEIRPFRDVLAMIRQRGKVEILDVDLFRRDEKWVYAVRLLTQRGHVRDVILDGKTLEPLQID